MEERDAAQDGCRRLKIVDQKTRAKLAFWQTVKRFLGYIVSTIPLSLGFIWILKDKDRQGWHDKIAKTLVLKRKNTQNTAKKAFSNETSASFTERNGGLSDSRRGKVT